MKLNHSPHCVLLGPISLGKPSACLGIEQVVGQPYTLAKTQQSPSQFSCSLAMHINSRYKSDCLYDAYNNRETEFSKESPLCLAISPGINQGLYQDYIRSTDILVAWSSQEVVLFGQDFPISYLLILKPHVSLSINYRFS